MRRDEDGNRVSGGAGRLPNAAQAIVERRKIIEYLLNPDHDQGASKAEFFSRFGFTAERWGELALALVEHGIRNPAKLEGVGPYGEEWVVVGPLACPDGRTPAVKSIWQMPEQMSVPRLITAYRFRR